MDSQWSEINEINSEYSYLYLVVPTNLFCFWQRNFIFFPFLSDLEIFLILCTSNSESYITLEILIQDLTRGDLANIPENAIMREREIFQINLILRNSGH